MKLGGFRASKVIQIATTFLIYKTALKIINILIPNKCIILLFCRFENLRKIF